jgi:hypothetical protein
MIGKKVTVQVQFDLAPLPTVSKPVQTDL